MKPIKKWLEEAKKQGHDWADAAIRNYDPDFSTVKEMESLRGALAGAFAWNRSPEGKDFWHDVHETLRDTTPVSPISLESLIEDLGKLNSAIGTLEYNETLKEPYRTQVYEAVKASYEEQLAEVKEKITETLGLKRDSAEELSILKRDFDRLLLYSQTLEVRNDGLSRELEAHKATAEELNKTYINEHNENYERMMKIEQLEKELEAVRSKKLIGWVTSDADGRLWRWDNALRKLPSQWERKVGIRLTTSRAMALCDRLPKWSDDEPTPIYE